MNYSVSATVSILCVIGLMPTVALGQQDRAPASFKTIDLNGDGFIDREEFMAGVRKYDVASSFKELDANKDGKISQEEAMRAYNRREKNREVARIISQVDTNKDGVVDRNEYMKSDSPRRSAESFNELDKNADGKLDRSEIALAVAKQRRSGVSDHVPEPGLSETYDQVAPAASPLPSGMPQRLLSDQAYDSLPGVDPRLLSLDLYAAEGDGPHPIMVMVHGGGWSQGDKTGRGVIAPKARWFSEQGWLFASVNYRLSPAVSHPEHANDVAQSIAWLTEHADEFNADPDRVFLMGHSAGAHIVAAVACDPRHLERAGLSPDIIKGTIPLDVGAYDMSLRTDLRPQGRAMYERAFGAHSENDPGPWVAASPITYTRHPGAGDRIAPFLLVSSSQRSRSFALANSEAFAQALNEAGVDVEIIAPNKNHSECNKDVGVPNDSLTIAISAFLERRLAELLSSDVVRKSTANTP